MAGPPDEYDETFLVYKNPESTRGFEHYLYDRQGYRDRVISSGAYTEEDISAAESEGCTKVVANSLCISPYTGMRRKICSEYPDKVIKGLRVMMKALAADEAEIIVSRENSVLFENVVKKTPNLFMKTVKDRYPLGMENIFYKRIFNSREDYFPGKGGVFIVPVEKLVGIYMEVFEEKMKRFQPVIVSTPEKNYFLWADKNKSLYELVKKMQGGLSCNCLVAGDPLWGRAIADPKDQKIGGIFCVTLLNLKGFLPGRCCGCGRCLNLCPVNLPVTRSEKYHYCGGGVQPRRPCLNCGLCLYFCPSTG